MDHAALPDGGLIPHADIDRLLPTEYQQQALEDLAPVSDDLVALAAEKTDLLDLAGDKKGAVDNLYDATGTSLFATDNDDEMITPDAVIVGPTGERGAQSLNIARFWTDTHDSSASHYIHIKTPFLKSQNRMYCIRAQGYAYNGPPSRGGSFVDLIWTGYLYSTSIIHTSNHDPSGNLNPTQYISANSPYNLYLRFGPLDPYYLTITINSIRVGNGTVLYPGDITITASTTASL